MTLEEKKDRVQSYCDKFPGCEGCPCFRMPCALSSITEWEADALLDTFENWECHQESHDSSALTVVDLGSCVRTEIPGKPEMVDHPAHYQGRHECIEVMRAMFGDEAVKSFCRCNSFKYRFRADKKNGEEDIRKAEFYEDYLMKMEGRI